MFDLKQTAPVSETAEASEQVSSEPIEPVSTAAGCWDGRDGFVHSARLLCQLFWGLQSLIEHMSVCSLSNHRVGLVLRMWRLFNKPHVGERVAACIGLKHTLHKCMNAE